MRKMSLWYGLVFANSDTYPITVHFARWHQIYAIQTPNAFQQNSIHLHSALVKLSKSNCCVKRNQTGFLTSKQPIPLQLTTRYGRPLRNVLTVQTSRALMNWNSGWFRSGSVFTGTLSTWLLADGLEYLEHAFVQNGTQFKHIVWTVTVYDLFCVTGLLKYSVLYCQIVQ